MVIGGARLCRSRSACLAAHIARGLQGEGAGDVSDDLNREPEGRGNLNAASIPRHVVQEAYDAAALTVSRLNSYAEDMDLLPYYEGRRDALRKLLEPQEADRG